MKYHKYEGGVLAPATTVVATALEAERAVSMALDHIDSLQGLTPIVNLCPHSLNIGEWEVEPSGLICRVSVNEIPTGQTVLGVPVVRTYMGLPTLEYKGEQVNIHLLAERRIVFLGSALAANALRLLCTCYAPHKVRRDADGQPQAAMALSWPDVDS